MKTEKEEKEKEPCNCAYFESKPFSFAAWACPEHGYKEYGGMSLEERVSRIEAFLSI